MTRYIFLISLFLSSLNFAQEINWVSINDAEKMQLQSPEKPMFIDVYTDWCGWCKQMDNTTFKNEEVVAFINEYYIPVKFDAEQKQEVTFKGQKFEYMEVGRKGVHQLAAALLQGNLSYPSYVVINSNNELTHLLRGFMKPNDLLNSF